MSSWHAPNCDRPRVEFGRDQVPRCRSCHRHFVPTPDLLLTDHTATAGEENAPVFEVPERQGPLQWPKSVKYQSSMGLQLPPKPPSQPRPRAAPRNKGYSDLISVEAESQAAAPESSNRLSQRRPVVSGLARFPCLVKAMFSLRTRDALDPGGSRDSPATDQREADPGSQALTGPL